jgi:hypothetical protein
MGGAPGKRKEALPYVSTWNESKKGTGTPILLEPEG